MSAETSTSRPKRAQQQLQKKPNAGYVQMIRRHLDVLFPDHDGNTTFGPAWKDDVSNHPDQYPQVLAALSTALGTQYTNHQTGK